MGGVDTLVEGEEGGEEVGGGAEEAPAPPPNPRRSLLRRKRIGERISLERERGTNIVILCWILKLSKGRGVFTY